MDLATRFLPIKPARSFKKIVKGVAPNGQSIISVVFGRRFAIGRDGRTTPLDDNFVLCEEPEDYKEIHYPGKYRPSLLARDYDAWTWRNFTDLVVQGVVRTERPRAELPVVLACQGSKTKIEHKVRVYGDRHVERGLTGFRFSDAQPFTEMPMRYDKAYGGTDELAEAKFGNPDLQRFFQIQLSEEENSQFGEFSYPRNYAGKGYLVDEGGLEGLALPNIEWDNEQVSMTNLVAPHPRWGERRYPAGFDWFPHAFFPRVAFFGNVPRTHDGKAPEREIRMGILAANITDLPRPRRPKHGFAQGAHPFLCRHRWVGDETISVSTMSNDGRPTYVILPNMRPKVKLRAGDAYSVVLDASLDLVFLETEMERLTLVWRATWMTKVELPLHWEANAEYEVQW